MRYLFLLFCVALLSQQCVAQSTPEEVVDTYFEQMASSRLDQIGYLMHPEELSKFRDMMNPIVTQALQTPEQAEVFAVFADSTNKQEIKALSDEEFMGTFMEWIAAIQPGFADVLKTATIETLGHITEGDVQHVVVRMTMSVEGIDVKKMSVMSLKDHNGEPRMMLTGEMEGIAAAFGQQ